MNRPIAEDAFSGKPADADEAPLDPAVERVRRKLVRFAVINIGILFLALAVVLAALAWRTVSASHEIGAPVEAALALPPGAAVLSHSVSPDAVSLLARLPDGTAVLFVFARADGHLTGRYTVAAPIAATPVAAP